jgi:hypothetical protein
VNHALMCFDQGCKSAVVAIPAVDYPTAVRIHRKHVHIFTQSDNPERGIL